MSQIGGVITTTTGKRTVLSYLQELGYKGKARLSALVITCSTGDVKLYPTANGVTAPGGQIAGIPIGVSATSTSYSKNSGGGVNDFIDAGTLWLEPTTGTPDIILDAREF
jgi:hypothetical protein